MKARLRRFFSVYDPTQLDTLNEFIQRWEGREGELLHHLEDSYGCEPLMTSGAVEALRATPPMRLAECRRLLIEFLSIYAPQRLVDVDAVMENWVGQEDILLDRLARQAFRRDYILRYFRQHFPHRETEVANLLKNWLGNERYLIQSLPNVPPVPLQHPREVQDICDMSGRNRLREFLAVCESGCASDVDALLDAFGGDTDTAMAHVRTQFVGLDSGLEALKGMPFRSRPQLKSLWEMLLSITAPSLLPAIRIKMAEFSGTEEDWLQFVINCMQHGVQ